LPKSKLPATRRIPTKARRQSANSAKRAPRTSRKQTISAVETAAWFAGKTFATDWTSWHFPNWVKWLHAYRERRVRVLEIGSWEGRSALFFLNHLSRSRLVCVDTFAGGQEHQRAADAATFLPQIEKRFDDNIAAFSNRIEKIKARSSDALPQLAIKRRRFDVAYVDGSHLAADVYADGALTWPLMTRGGLVIFDDYQLKLMPEKLENAKPGIDAFLTAFAGQYRVVHRGYQVAIVKL
jgi:predicted O-methyltransferase YrrM